MSQGGASVVDNDWLEYYKECECNLNKLMDILHDREFTDFYDDNGDHWQDYIIQIHDLADIRDPGGHYNKGNKRRRGDRELE